MMRRLASLITPMLLLLLSLPAVAQKVGTLPSASVPFSGAEQLYLIQQGVSKRTTLGAIQAGGVLVPWVPTNNALAATAAPVGFRELRGGINAIGDAPTQMFTTLVGTCAANGFVNDIGHCVNAADGNSWVANVSFFDCTQFGIPAHGADGTAQAQACLDAAGSAAPAIAYFPRSFDFTTGLATYSGVCVVGGGTGNPWHRTQAGLGLYTTTDPAHKGYPTANVVNPCMQHLTIIADIVNGCGLPGANIVVALSGEFHLWDVNSFGTDTCAAEGTGNVVGSTLTVLSSLLTSSVTAGGSGYVRGEIVTLAGGTATHPAKLDVDSIDDGGGILKYTVLDSGAYSVTAGNLTQASTTGSGTGATFGSATWGLNQGTIVAGQMVICQLCGYSGDPDNPNMTNNSYPTVRSGGGPGTYSLSNTFHTNTGAATPLVFSTPWTWTTSQNTTFPSANIFIMDLSEGEIIGASMGNIPAAVGMTCSSFSGIGLALDSVHSDGGGKPNNLHFTGVKDWCQILGTASFNGSDNTYINGLHQNTVIGRLEGTGGTNSFRNNLVNEYYEPQVKAPVGQAAIIEGPNGTDNQFNGLGSTTYAAFPYVILDSNATGTSRNEVRLNNDQTYHGSSVVHTFYAGINAANVPKLPNVKTFLFDGDDTHYLEIAGKAYQSTETVVFSGILQDGQHSAVPSPVQTNERMVSFGGRGQASATPGDYCGARTAYSIPGGLPCGSMDVVAEAGFTTSQWPTRLEFWTTPIGSTTRTLAGLIDNAQNWVEAPSAAIATNANSPFVYIPTMAGAPSGTPTAATAGRSAIVIDSTDSKICFYINGTGWKCAAGS